MNINVYGNSTSSRLYTLHPKAYKVFLNGVEQKRVFEVCPLEDWVVIAATNIRDELILCGDDWLTCKLFGKVEVEEILE